MSQVKITVFDDGNDVYKQYENRWYITGSKFHGSKVELTNTVEKDIKIKSISAWKVQIIEKNSVNFQP